MLRFQTKTGYFLYKYLSKYKKKWKKKKKKKPDTYWRVLSCFQFVRTSRPHRSVREWSVIISRTDYWNSSKWHIPRVVCAILKQVQKAAYKLSFNWCIPFAKWLARQLCNVYENKNEQECFIGFKTTRRSGVVFDPIKHVLRVFWTALKTFLEKRVSIEFITITLLWTLEISIREKHRILIRRRFIDIKWLHVMYYRPFDRSMGLWIINDFLMTNGKLP